MNAQYVQDLFTLDLNQLQKKYKQKSNPNKPRIKDQRSLNQLRRKYRMENLPQETTREYEEGGQIIQETDGWWDVITSNPNDPENPVVTRAYKHSIKREPLQETEEWSPATPAKISPSRKKGIQRDHRVYFVFGDAQIDYRRMDDNELIPLHDERAMRVARMICRDLQPDEIVNLGDNVDLSSLSRFKADSDHFHRTLGPSFQRAHDYYAELRSENPTAKIVEVSSNHEVRLRDWVLKNMPQVYGLKRPGEEDYPVMTYPYLTNLKAVGVDWIGGYGAAEYEIGGNDDLIARHGRETSSNGTTASKIMKNYPETNNIHGHSHEMGVSYKTLRSGRLLASVAVGALCKTDGTVPGYHSAVDDHNRPVHRQQNWQNGVLAIYDYDGQYQFDQIPIVDGKAFYQGRQYNGE
jgi:hypothetical protein